MLIGYFTAAIISLGLSLGLGTVLMGRLYDPWVATTDARNGELASQSVLVGIYLLVFIGSLSFMLFINAVPSLVVFGWPRPLYVASLLSLTFAFIVGAVLCLVYMIEPEKTFTTSVVTGTNDRGLVCMGAFFMWGFGFLAMLTGGILLRGFPSADSSVRRVLPNGRHRAAALMILLVFLL